MSDQTTQRGHESTLCWERLEAWAREKIQGFLQALLEEEVTTPSATSRSMAYGHPPSARGGSPPDPIYTPLDISSTENSFSRYAIYVKVFDSSWGLLGNDPSCLSPKMWEDSGFPGADWVSDPPRPVARLLG